MTGAEPPPATRPEHERLLGLLSRRQLLARASTVGLGAMIAAAVPLARIPAAARAAARPGLTDADFLHLPFARRVQTCLGGLDYANPTRLVWEAAAAVPFTAFCAAAMIRNARAADACGYRVMGLPGTAPNGYRHFSYRRKLSPERTPHGSLP